MFYDFQRRDGSVWLRASPYRTDVQADWPKELIRVAPDGRVLVDSPHWRSGIAGG